MKLKQLAKTTLLALSGMVVFATSAGAQNTASNPRDLLLYFLDPGQPNVVIASLGNVETMFRDATPGSYTTVANIGTQLVAAYGSNWFDTTTLWMGAVSNNGTFVNSNVALMNQGDPGATVYGTLKRSAIGNVGEQYASTFTIASGNMQTCATQINTVNNNIEAVSGSNPVVTLAKSSTIVDDYNTFLGSNPNIAYGAFTNGVIGNFDSGSLGTFGSAGVVELALDLFRYQAFNNVAGQYGAGEATYSGKFLGTVTITSSGQVGFIAVPEPSTALLAGFALAGVALRRRRK